MEDLNNFKYFNIINKIPIMRDKTIKFLFDMFFDYHNVNILEIGTGFGYSCIYLSRHKNVVKIISLENNKNRFNVALKATKDNKKISVINISAYDYCPTQKFDCIILDGPKSKLNVLFNKYCKYLSNNGFMFIDNINLFHDKNFLSNRQIELKQKVEKFKMYLESMKKNWSINIYNIEDGFSIIKKNENLSKSI